LNSQEDRTEQSQTILYRARLHWATFLGPVTLFLVGSFNIGSKGLPAYILTALALVWGIASYVRYSRFQIALTKTSIIVSGGLFSKSGTEYPLSEIVAADTYQPSLGALLNFGKVMIVRKNGVRHAYRLVTAPMDFVVKLKELAARAAG
jgi:uncharacterized membrane protein YdbT with pleckstrin-like domain